MVKRYDNILRYQVGSRSRPTVQHLVDLDMYGGNGACSCEHFTFKLEPFLKKGAPAQDGLRCRHIREARSRLADDIISRANQGINNPRKTARAAASREEKPRGTPRHFPIERNEC